jgi:hypothetical protein
MQLGDPPGDDEAHVKGTRRAVVCLVALAACLGAGCSPDELREDQARELKELCVSFTLRKGSSEQQVRRVQRRPFKEFMIGRSRYQSGVDVLNRCS